MDEEGATEGKGVEEAYEENENIGVVHKLKLMQ